MDLDNLDLSVRSRTILRALNVNTIEALASFDLQAHHGKIVNRLFPHYQGVRVNQKNIDEINQTLALWKQT